jgi:hypothetical protein
MRRFGNEGAVANAARACRAQRAAERAAELALRRIGAEPGAGIRQPYRTSPFGDGTKSAARR